MPPVPSRGLPIPPSPCSASLSSPSRGWPTGAWWTCSTASTAIARPRAPTPSPRRRCADAGGSLAEALGRMAARPSAEARLGHELAAATRRQDDVLAVLSHELRTPLTAMMAWLQLLHHGAEPAETARALDIIERNGRLLSRLIDDLMDTSHIVMGKLRVERRP